MLHIIQAGNNSSGPRNEFFLNKCNGIKMAGDTFSLNTTLCLVFLVFLGCVGVHGFGGAWGLFSIGLFKRSDNMLDAIIADSSRKGLFYVGINMTVNKNSSGKYCGMVSMLLM